MKHSIRTIFLGAVIASNAWAIEPSNGWYLGAFGGLSYQPSVDFNLQSPFSTLRIPGQVSYDPLANGGFEIGYRCDNVRFEGEVFFNENFYNKLRIGGFNIPYRTQYQQGFAFKGSTEQLGGFINFYYDFFSEDRDTNFVPYVGIGIGYGRVENRVKFYFNQIQVISDNETDTVPMGQIILGSNYFFNEDWSLGLDLRYLATKTIEPYNERSTLASINLVLNYTFDEL